MTAILQKNTPAVRLAPALAVKLASTRQGIVTGHASTFGGEPDSYGDVIAPGAFARTLADHKAQGTLPAMLWAHDQSRVIGKWTMAREDDRGLYVEGKLNTDTSGGKDAYAHVRDGDASGLSIGYAVSTKGSAYQNDGSTLLTDIDLVEVSVVAIPANRNARISSVKSVGSKGELIDLLREAGMAKAAAARVAAGGWPALAGEDQEKATALAERIAKATQNLRTK